MISDWLIIIVAVLILWALWGFMGFVIDLFVKAARRREDLPN